MPAIHETAYPRIKPNLNSKELKEIFTPNDEELALIASKTKETVAISRLGFIVMLKCYQYLGRPVNIKTIDQYIIKFIANSLNIDPKTNLNSYNQKTRKRHIKVIRDYLQIKQDNEI